ncbi:MAG: hypothetical protein IJA61_02275 [Clostridia bacterium]|nr:hypothetical protein [Clostridia bacterium]
MIIEKEFKDNGFDNIVCYSGRDITEDLIKRCLNLDTAFYEKEFYWDNTDIINVVKENPQMCFIFVDTIRQNIIGYSYWFPIKLDIINKFIHDKEPLLDIKKEYISGYKTSPVHLFLGGEAFVPGYDLMLLHKVIEDIFQWHILVLAQNGVKVDNICFDAVCDYDKFFLVKNVGLNNCVIKKNCSFYYGKYSPNIVYNESKYCKELKKYY